MSAEYPSEKCLLKLPDVAMNKVLGMLDFEAVQCLRKTCHTIRNFIDAVEPDSALTKLKISVYPNYINSLYLFDEASIEVKYCKRQEGCLVNRFGQDQEKLLESVDFLDVASRDIISILTNQKPVLKSLEVECCPHGILEGQPLYQVSEQFLSNLESYLVSRPKKLQVNTFTTHVSDETQILHILPHLEVENMTIRNGRANSNRDSVLNLQKVIELEQWKTLDTLNVFGFCVDLKLEDLLHLKRCFVKYETVDTAMLEELKEAFRTCSHLEFFRIEHGLTDIQDLMDPSYAGPLLAHNPFGDVIKRWFFSVCTPDRVLKITISLYQIVLDFDLLENVPEGVTVN